MINENYFKELNKELINILDNSNLIPKEKTFRKRNLNLKLLNMLNDKKIDNHYLSLAHEIKSYDFLKKYGCIKMAEDSKNQTGPDFKINNYNIECVCCSSGQTNKNGLDNYRFSENRKSMLIDYNKLLEILLPRITQELNEKSKKFQNYIDKRYITKK